MADAPFLGTGYTMLPIRRIVEDGLLPKFPDAALAVYVTIAAHADGETGVAFPGYLQIARFSGIGKSAIGDAIRWLEANGWLAVDRSRHNFIYRLLGLEDRFNPKVAVPIRSRVVLSGSWARCPGSGRRAYIALLARSQPGRPGEFDGVGSNFDEIWEEVRGEEGYRHVPLERSDPKDLKRLTGLPERTLCYALSALDRVGLTDAFEDSCEILLPNTPLKHFPQVLESLRAAREKDEARSVSRGARISAGRRRNKKFGKS